MISSTRLPSICTLALALWPDLTVRIKQLIFSHFSQHSQHKPRHGLSAGQTYRLRGIRSGLECHRPPGREESRIKETTQCFSKSGQQQESLQRAQDDALLSTRERLIMSGHITGIIGLPSDTSLWLCDSVTLWWERVGLWLEQGQGIQSWSIDCLPGKLIISLTQTINTDTAAISSSLLLQSVGSYQTLSHFPSFIGPHFQYSTLSKLVGADVAMLTFINLPPPLTLFW